MYRQVRHALLPLASAVLLAAAFPPWNATLLAWIGLIPLGLAIRTVPAGAAIYVTAAISGPLFHLIALDWIRTSYQGVGLSGVKAVPWLLIGVVMVPCVPVLLWIGRRASQRIRLPLWTLLPILWVGYEYARMQVGLLVQGAPFVWVQIGHTQVEHLRFIQLADLGGVWLVTAVVAMVNGALCDLWMAARATGGRQAITRPVVAVVAIAGATWSYGDWRLTQQTSEVGPRVCLMPAHSAAELATSPQPSLATESSSITHRHTPKADLLVWSELALDYALFSPCESAENSTSYATDDLGDCLSRQAALYGAPLAVGLPRIDARARRYNSMAVIDPTDGTIRCYDKWAIVPWSEFLPYWAAGFVEDRTAGYSPGNCYPLFELRSTRRQSYRYAIAICYDICFPSVMRGFFRARQRPDFFVVPACESADRTGSVQQWMLAMARLRAIECRRAIIRNVEGGYSGLIDGSGRVVHSSSPAEFQQPTLLPAAPIDRRSSPYLLLGDWLPISMLTLSLAFCLIPRPIYRPAGVA